MLIVVFDLSVKHIHLKWPVNYVFSFNKLDKQRGWGGGGGGITTYMIKDRDAHFGLFNEWTQFYKILGTWSIVQTIYTLV